MSTVSICLPERRTQTQDVGPYEHSRVSAARWIDEVRVGSAVGRLDLDVLLRDGLRVRRARQHDGEANAGGQTAEIAARDAP